MAARNGQGTEAGSAAKRGHVEPTSNEHDGAVGDEVRSRLETFNQYRVLLFSIAYRMLGSVADAEDVVQETFLRWQQATFDTLQSPRAFLVTITSRLCINQLQSARAQREHYVGQWLPEPVMTDGPDSPLDLVRLEESISMAFLVMLERLTAIERAVFLLREVFDYEYKEIASILDQNEANCRQIFHRARRHIGAERPRFTAPRPQHSEILRQFLTAAESGDLADLIKLLADDVVLLSDGGGKAPAVPNVVTGAERVGRGILGALKKFVPKGVVRRLAEINGAPGFVSYVDDRPFSVVVLEVKEERINALYVITNPEKISHLRVVASHGLST